MSRSTTLVRTEKSCFCTDTRGPQKHYLHYLCVFKHLCIKNIYWGVIYVIFTEDLQGKPLILGSVQQRLIHSI